MKLINSNAVAGQMRTLLKLMAEHTGEVEKLLDEHMAAHGNSDLALCEAQLCVAEAVGSLADATSHLTGKPTGQLKAMIDSIRQALHIINRCQTEDAEQAMIEREGATVH